jgi:hypothetical protein
MERSEFGSQLRVIYGEGDRERPLDQARVVRLRLVSRSVKDIPTAAFDDGAPLIIDLGTPVLAILGDHEPTQPSRPPITDCGNQVRIMPRLIKKGQVITINVLVDGISYVQVFSPLIEVRVSEKTGSWLARLGQRSSDAGPESPSDIGTRGVLIVALIGAAATVTAALIGSNAGQDHITITPITPAPTPTVSATVSASAKPSR